MLEDRDDEAQRDFSVLQKELGTQKKPVVKKVKSMVKEDAITKELHVLEGKQRKEQAQEQKIAKKEKKDREDRDALAEQYCEYLKWALKCVCVCVSVNLCVFVNICMYAHTHTHMWCIFFWKEKKEREELRAWIRAHACMKQMKTHKHPKPPNIHAYIHLHIQYTHAWIGEATEGTPSGQAHMNTYAYIHE